jgi:D-alanine transaminase
MATWVYVSGRFVYKKDAVISIEDRGLQFADSVYEVIWVREGELVDLRGHMDRLYRSLSELEIKLRYSHNTLVQHIKKVIAKNRLKNGKIYLQITRGTHKREFAFPPESVRPNVIIVPYRGQPHISPKLSEGIAVITFPDLRWKRCDIKTTGLLAQSLAKQAALKAGAFDALMVDEESLIMEGSASNAWIVTKDGVLRTHPKNYHMLKGVTRTSFLALCEQHHLAFSEVAFSKEELYSASEAFLTAATTFAWPILKADNNVIGDGTVGPVTKLLQKLYFSYAEVTAGDEDSQTPWHY